ncbi:nucleotidyltransferase family protein [Agromyces sp. MMS24-JH15]|uniref:nucleotidyltransferase family protein n=1 Tax=Agromyces sp. MMS24-JH15 TaxID=3243765 RepID=UPI0037487EFB
MPAPTPIKVDAATDRLVADAAYLLGRTKKDIVAAAVSEYFARHRDELQAGVEASSSRVAASTHPLRERVRAKRDELTTALGQLGGRNIRLFGSVARGEETDASDIDLLVDLDVGVGLFGLAGMESAAERILGVPVDVVPAADLKPDAEARILAEAVEL